MERKIVKVSDTIIGRYENYTLDGLINLLKESTNRVPEELRPSVRFEIDMETYPYDSYEYPRLFMHYQRPETDAEYELRKKNEENSKHLRELRDKADYERLRKQFEGK